MFVATGVVAHCGEVKVIDAAKLIEWRELTNAATPGAWVADESKAGPRRFNNARVRRHDGVFILEGRLGRPQFVDAQFIAAAREAVPALLDEVERLRAELARLAPAQDAPLTDPDTIYARPESEGGAAQ